MENFVRRRFRIEKEDVFDHDPTQGCPGCRAIIEGAKSVNHSEECRRRLEKIFTEAQDARMARQCERLTREDERIEGDNRDVPIMNEVNDGSNDKTPGADGV